MLVVYMCDHFCVFDNLVYFPVWLYFLSAGNFFLTVAGNRIDFGGSLMELGFQVTMMLKLVKRITVSLCLFPVMEATIVPWLRRILKATY